VDAGNALNAFYGALLPPWDGYAVVGDPGPAFITAMAPAGALSAKYFGSPMLYDLAQTTVGGNYGQTYGPTTQVVGSKYYYGNGGTVQFTTWTPVAQAPEIDQSSMAGALTLLFGGIALMRGARRTSRSRIE
jgi:hypothetical protein